MIKLDVQKFKRFIQKSTLNYSVDKLQLKMEDKRIHSGMMSGQRDVVTMIDIENDIIGVSEHDTIVLNFSQPSVKLIPYLDIIDEPEAEVVIEEDQKLIIIAGHLKNSIGMTSSAALENFVLNKSSKDTFPYFHTMKVDDDMFKVFDKIKRIGPRFGKIYINIEDGKLSIETTDKINPSSNGTKITLASGIQSDNLSVCFDFKNFVNLTTVLELSEREFEVRFAYIASNDGGLIHTVSTDEAEQYFLLNREDN